MRKPDIILQEIQDLDKVMLSIRESILIYPDDTVLSLNLEQSEFRKQELVSEYQLSLTEFGRHAIKYVFTNIKEKISIENLIDNLSSFKTLIDKTFESVVDGKENHIPIYFNTVFSGSFGVFLSTGFESKLFDHDYDKAISYTIDTISELINTDKEDVSQVLNDRFKNNKNLINRYAVFFRKLYQTEKSIKISWINPRSKIPIETELDYQKAYELFKFCTSHQDREEIVELYGILKGLSLIRYKVEFVKDSEGKEIITAKFDEKLTDKVKESLDKYVIAQFKTRIEFNELTDQESRKFELIDIVYKKE